MTETKTVQALKIAVTWRPKAEAAATIADTLFAWEGARLRVDGGALKLKHAILANFSDPDYMTKASARIAIIKAGLNDIGEIISFTTTAGAVPRGEAEDLTPPPADKEPDQSDLTEQGSDHGETPPETPPETPVGETPPPTPPVKPARRSKAA